MQHFSLACIVSIIWVIICYSLAFSEGNALIGGLENVFMNSIELETPSESIPKSLFATLQITFAIITPALMIGTFMERIKFSSMLSFLSLWI